jgi:hypothetical protein
MPGFRTLSPSHGVLALRGDSGLGGCHCGQKNIAPGAGSLVENGPKLRVVVRLRGCSSESRGGSARPPGGPGMSAKWGMLASREFMRAVEPLAFRVTSADRFGLSPWSVPSNPRKPSWLPGIYMVTAPRTTEVAVCSREVGDTGKRRFVGNFRLKLRKA